MTSLPLLTDQQEEVGPTDTASEMSTTEAMARCGVEEEDEDEDEQKIEKGSRKGE